MVEQVDIRENTRAIFEMLNSRDFSPAPDLMTDDFTYRNTTGEQVQGVDGLEERVSTYSEAFDDLEFTIEEMYTTEGENRGVCLYRQTGTHTGELQGMVPSGNEMDILICSIGTFDDDGRLVDVYDILDTMQLMRQLDALPPEMEQQIVSGSQPGA